MNTLADLENHHSIRHSIHPRPKALMKASIRSHLNHAVPGHDANRFCPGSVTTTR